MEYPIYKTKSFRKDVRRLRKRSKPLHKLYQLLERMSQGLPLSRHHQNHTLLCWPGCWECHIESDWLLVYKIQDEMLWLVATGSHSDLF
ncbi:type II toxin-antitoxin system YafQ family toxin [Brasilonema sp. CT11]|nr:type II toxin-antitoxin system YafQ family toxin [Brasilonema sp. CT11]